MPRTKHCPICGKLCRVAADGRTGYCKTEKQRWKVEKRKTGDLKPGPIRHTTLPPVYLEIARWTYEVVGRFVESTLEQWELAFMRDAHPERELGFWARCANAYTKFLKSKDRDPRTISQEEGAFLVSLLVVTGTQGSSFQPSAAVEEPKDEAVRQRLRELNRPEVFKELGDIFLTCNGRVPREYVNEVEDESVRASLRKLQSDQ